MDMIGNEFVFFSCLLFAKSHRELLLRIDERGRDVVVLGGFFRASFYKCDSEIHRQLAR